MRKRRRVLPALARVRAGAEPVERDRDRLVRLGRQRAVRHRSAREPAHDLLGRLDLLERRGWAGRYELEEVARLQRRPLVDERREAVVEVRAPVANRDPQRVRAGDGGLQRIDDVGVGRVRLPTLAELVVAGVVRAGPLGTRRLQPREGLALEPLEPGASDRRRSSGEELRAQRAVEPDGLEEARAPIARDVRDPHLGHHLEDAFLEGCEQPPLSLGG